MRTKGQTASRQPTTTLTLLAALLACCCGCPFPLPPGLPNLDTPANATLNDATALPLNPPDEFRFTGSIDTTADIDVFGLGTLSPGDSVFIEVQRSSGDLDPVAAIFDSREYLIAFNDDRSPDGSNLNPQIDIVIRDNEDTYYLGIIAYPGYVSSGSYDVTVRVQRAVGVPAPRGQIVYLDWAGGSGIEVPNVGVFDLSPFSADDVGLPASQTETLKDRTQQIVEQRYADFDLLVLNSDDDQVPAVPHSTIYFGGSNRQAFAISEQIDTFNRDPADDAIIFSESYRGAFGAQPALEQMAQALGNTIAHELAHLLGLVHTHDCESLMDSTCANVRILTPQEFKTAPLDDSVFPFGWQPAHEILTWILGLVGL